MRTKETVEGSLVPTGSSCLGTALTVSVLMFLSIVFISSATASETWVVDDDWDGADFSTIQEAIDVSSDTDTIRVHEGFYDEEISVPNRLTIMGNGTTETVIDGSADHHTVVIGHNTVTIGDMSIIASGTGYALVSDGYDNLAVIDCDLRAQWRAVDIRNGDDISFARTDGSAVVTGIYARSVTDLGIGDGKWSGGGLWLIDVDRLRVIGSTFEDTWGSGIYAEGNEVVIGVTVTSPGKNGVRVIGDDAHITGCRIYDAEEVGILVEGDRALVVDSIVQNSSLNGMGIDGYRAWVYRCTVTNSTENGIDIAGEDSIVHGAHVYDGSMIGVNVQGDDAVVELSNITGDDNAMVINGRNNSVTTSVFQNSLYVRGEDANVTDDIILGNLILALATNAHVSDVDLYGEGIWGRYSSDCVIEDVTITDDRDQGVFLDHSDRFQFRNVLIDNSSGSAFHIYFSDNTTLDDVVVRDSYSGIMLHASNGTIISNCTLQDNAMSGVIVRAWSNDNVVQDSWIRDNGRYGVKIWRAFWYNCTGNVIRRNIITNNGDNTSQGYDECPGNLWNGSVGNFWNDYDGKDSDADRIGDSPYDILGGDARDLRPVADIGLLDEYPVIEGTTFTPEVPLRGQTVEFECSATDNRAVVAYIWSSNLDGELYNGSDASFTTGELGPGRHDISVTVVDDRGSIVEHSFILLVNIRATVEATSPLEPISGTFMLTGAAADDERVALVEVSIDGGDWKPAYGTTVWTYVLDTTEFENGEHEVRVRSWDGLHHSNESVLTVDILNRPSEPPGPIIQVDEPATWVGVGAATGVVAFSFTGVGFYFILSLLFPLFVRLRGDKITDQKTRGKIIEYLRRNPGAYFRLIASDLEMSNGALGYHLRVLEVSGFVRSRRDGHHKRFYPHGYRVPEFILEPREERVVALVGQYPGIPQIGLAQRMSLTPATISHHIANLKRKNVVTATRGGGVRLTADFLGILETEKIKYEQKKGQVAPGPEKAGK